MTENKITIIIIYNNTAYNQELTPDWGFSCLVDAYGHKILFDTGAKSSILFEKAEQAKLLKSDFKAKAER